jgi:alcohol dehydrogenase class IV
MPKQAGRPAKGPTVGRSESISFKVMRFEFATADRILFGAGVLAEAVPLMARLGNRALAVTGRDRARSSKLAELLRGQNMEVFHYSFAGEPTTECVMEGVRYLASERCEFVIGFGGGSAIDAAKAIAALATNPPPLTDYLEVIGAGTPLARPPLPCVAIPTTAGTGAEVTRNAVLSSPPHRVKVSLRSPLMLPALAVVDPVLTLDLSPQFTASTGLDALTQLIEPYVSTRANPLTDGFCLEGIRRVASSLRVAYAQGRDLNARTDMALAGLLGGLALANAGLGAVHGFAGPIGGMHNAPHGTICAALLPHVLSANLAALHQRSPQHPVLSRFHTVARLLTGRPDATAADAIHWLKTIGRDLNIPTLGQLGLERVDQPVLVEKAERASSMKANPVPLTKEELLRILEEAW